MLSYTLTVAWKGTTVKVFRLMIDEKTEAPASGPLDIPYSQED